MKENKCTYYVDGMHCKSCELLIEKKVKDINGVKKVKANINKNTVDIIGDVSESQINKMFKEEGYTFSKTKTKKEKLISVEEGKLYISKRGVLRIFLGLLISSIIIFLFILLENSKVEGLVSINSDSSYISFFLFGLIAGSSGCSALVAGLLLSLTDQWTHIHSKNKTRPFLMFIIGRTISFALLGGLLGLLGKVTGLNLSTNPILSAVIIGIISIYMLLLGLDMLGVHWLEKLQLRSPKFLSKYITDETNFKGKYMPFIVGALTFFIPCAFTFNTQVIAMSSGGFITGMIIMLLFVLGSVPLLAMISLLGISLNKKPRMKIIFDIVAGILVILFALYNVNAQLNVLGLPSFTDLQRKIESSTYTSTIINEKQILKTIARADGYYPNYSVVKEGIPIEWQVVDDGTTGCTNGIVSTQLFGSKRISLTSGVNTIQIPALNKGTYKYSCWMGMYSGVIKVI